MDDQGRESELDSLRTWVANLERLLAENRRAEAALRASEARYRATLMSIGDGVIVTDTEERVELLNPVAETLTGWPQEEARGRPLSEVFRIVNEKTRQPVENPVQRVLREGIVVGLANHTLLIARSGAEYPIADCGAPIRDEEGVIRGVVLVFRDQTEERRAQRAVQEARRLAEGIVETVREPLIVLDGSLRVVTANRAFYHTFQVTPQETQGRHVYDLGNRQWDIPDLRRLLEDILPQNTSFDDFVVEHEFKRIGRRTMLLNARRIYHEGNRTALILLAIEDITERRQTEAALRASEARYRLLNELLSDYAYAFRVEADGSLTREWIAGGFERVTGFTPEESQARGGWVALIHPEDMPVAQARARRLFANQLDISEFRIVRKDGEVRWLRDHGYPIWDAQQGRVVRIYGAAQDITERRQAEMAEREQRQLAEALLATATTINSLLHLDEVLERILVSVRQTIPYDSANIMLIEGDRLRVACRLREAGPERGELLPPPTPLASAPPNLSQMRESGQPLVIPDVRECASWVDTPTTSWVRAYAGAPIHIDREVAGFLNLDSATPHAFSEKHGRWLQAFADQAAIAIRNAQLYSELENYSSLLEQAVEERTAELWRTKARVEAILNSSPDAILILDTDGHIKAANPTFSAMFSYTPAEFLDQPFADLCVVSAPEALQQALVNARNGQTQRLECTVQHKNGTAFDADLALAPVEEGQGQVEAIVLSLRDISPLKEAERMKDAFVSNVSHELRTPITSIKLNHRLLDMDPANRAVYMGRLGREIDRLNDLIEDLLHLSRLDQGRVVPSLAPTDLNELAAQYADDRAALAASRGLKLALSARPGIPPVQADRGLLGQVLSILLTNAIHYTPAGGRVVISTQAREVEGGQEVGFSVSDTGPGISPEEMPYLFKRFYRGKVGRESGVPGTGLGLSLAEEIVRRHSGRIEVSSRGVPGEGATFTVWLPAAPPSEGE